MWRHGSVVRSWLLDLTAEFLKDDAMLANVAPVVADSGEGRWTVQRSGRAGRARAGARAGADGALRSQGKADYADKMLAMMRKGFGGHAVQRAGGRRRVIVVADGRVRLRQDDGRARRSREQLGWPFLDADDFHPQANVAKMAAGVPLTDDDRWPWLDRIATRWRAIMRAAGTRCWRARR